MLSTGWRITNKINLWVYLEGLLWLGWYGKTHPVKAFYHSSRKNKDFSCDDVKIVENKACFQRYHVKFRSWPEVSKVLGRWFEIRVTSAAPPPVQDGSLCNCQVHWVALLIWKRKIVCLCSIYMHTNYQNRAMKVSLPVKGTALLVFLIGLTWTKCKKPKWKWLEINIM